ncbi:hypothetical protein PRK78_003391 [Emydomyces testavorans]|uniref:Phosphatidate phosphatase APP1 catalytic domain-containing protein n=1 Tax=Emydomyces testavorans TaxID=2070801 RepID=A0AAF0DFY8_9EURO|nr:hypothetical protein PRK78_003391 [Emydomyces testavorans]
MFFFLSSGVFSGPASTQEFTGDSELSTLIPPPSQRQQATLLSNYEWRYALEQFNDYVESLTDDGESEDNFYLSHGALDMFSLLPTQEEILQAIDPSEANIAGTSFQTLNLPQYGNWTNEAWLLRFRGYVFTQPLISNKTIESFVSKVLGFPAWTLTEDQYLHAMQMVRGLFVLVHSNIQLSWRLIPEDGLEQTETGGDYQIWPPIRNEVIAPGLTDFAGDYDFFANLSGVLDEHLLPGDSLNELQSVYLHSNATSNAGIPISYLVPGSGLTIVSDIDDVLRVSTIYHPTEGLRNLLTRPFYPWMNMHDVFANWSQSLPDVHFHYLSTAPDQMAQSYMDFIYETYPHGSFDTRAVNFKRFRASWSARRGLLERVLQTYPQRKFILIGDNSNHDIMKNYPLLALKYPAQILCVFVRNVSASDDTFRWPYTTRYFKSLEPEKYMMFRYPTLKMAIATMNRSRSIFLSGGKASHGAHNSLQKVADV